MAEARWHLVSCEIITSASFSILKGSLINHDLTCTIFKIECSNLHKLLKFLFSYFLSPLGFSRCLYISYVQASLLMAISVIAMARGFLC